MSDEEERKYRCTKCGRIGSVGRCCGRNTLVAICKERDNDKKTAEEKRAQEAQTRQDEGLTHSDCIGSR